MRVMPAEFLPGAKPAHGREAQPAPAVGAGHAPPLPAHAVRRRWVLWIGLGLLGTVLAGSGLALWLLREREPATQPQPQAAAPTTTAQVSPEAGAGPQTPAGRDEVRLQHISNLHTAFEQYRQANGRYPEQLSQLSAYLPNIPADPSGAGYPYQPSADGSSYQVQFTLEAGGTYRGLRLLPNSYTLTPLGVQVPTPESATPTSTVPEPGATPPPPTADADVDGLTDVEEAQYTADVNVADTDGDGYVDGVEVRGGYDPLAPARTMAEAGLVQRYDNVAQGYGVSYPTGWITRALDAPQSTQVTFTSPNGEFFQVLAEENPSSLTSVEWYQQQFPGADGGTVSLATIAGRTAVRSPDGLTAYLADGGRVYVLAYSLGGASQASYAATFEMFLASFTLGS